MLFDKIHNMAFAFWRILPISMRRKVIHTFLDWLRGELSDVCFSSVLNKNVPRIIVGFLSSPSGLGQSARLAAKALIAEGYKVYGIDLSPFFYEGAGLISHGLPNGRDISRLAHVIIVINAPYLPYALALLGRKFLRDKYVTGYWAWELEHLPSSWARGYECVHDIAVPSTFVANAVSSFRDDRPVTVLPHPVALDHPACEVPSSAGDDAPFTVINAINVASGFERKNPLAVIAAFREAFGNDKNCRLRMLVTNAEHHPPARPLIEKAIEGASNVEIAWKGMSRGALWRWWGRPHVYLSMHRSEGFGLPLAEAMCAGIPVVATGWSGNMEFMSDSNAYPVRHELIDVHDPQEKYPDGLGRWAEPDTAHAAAILIDIRRNWQRAARKGAKAARELRERLSAERFVRNLYREPAHMPADHASPHDPITEESR